VGIKVGVRVGEAAVEVGSGVSVVGREAVITVVGVEEGGAVGALIGRQAAKRFTTLRMTENSKTFFLMFFILLFLFDTVS
jgi:hypothetical protein